MLATQSVLIVGGGFIGKAAVRALTLRGHSVSVLTRAPAPLPLEDVNWVYGDIDSPQLDELLPGVGAVICASGTIAPATKLDSVATALTDEVVPVIRLAERAAKAGARRLIFISSGGTVYGPAAHIPTPETASAAPINTYGLIKVATEYALLDVARRTDLAVTILRVSNPYGPGQLGTRQLGFVAAAIHASLKETGLTIWGDGSVTRDFVFIDDVGRAIAMAVESDGGSAVLNIASGVATSLRQVCAMVSKATGKPISTTFEEGRVVDAKASMLCIRRAAEILSWQPEVSLADGIDVTVAQAD